MGQHKYNPTAIAAKEGKIKPRAKRQSSGDLEKSFRAYLAEKFLFAGFVEKIIKRGEESENTLQQRKKGKND